MYRDTYRCGNATPPVARVRHHARRHGNTGYALLALVFAAFLFGFAVAGTQLRRMDATAEDFARDVLKVDALDAALGAS